MSKIYSIKGIIQKTNKAGVAPVSVCYTYNGVKLLIAVGFSVPESDFDKKKGMMKTDATNASIINQKIRIVSDMLAGAADAFKIPSREVVKAAYNKKVAEQKAKEADDAAKQKLVATAKKGVQIIHEIEFTEAVEKKAELSKSLSEVDAELERLKAEGLIDISEEEHLFRKLLAEYPYKFKQKSDLQYRQMKHWVSLVTSFADDTKTPLLFSEMNSKFYVDFGTYLMYTKDYFNSSFGQQVKRLKTFLNYCTREHQVAVNQAYKKWDILEDEPPVVYLTDDELDKLYNEFRATVTPAKQKLIDVIVFQNLCGFRYSDVVASKWNVVNDVLIGYPTKQNKQKEGKKVKPYQIPLLLDSRIKEILERYDYKMKHFADAVYNREMKDLYEKFFEKYEIDNSDVTYYKHKFQKEFKVTTPKHKLFSSHSCRKAFVIRWAKRFDDSVILSMLGSSSLKELQRYKDKSTDNLLSIIQSRLQPV